MKKLFIVLLSVMSISIYAQVNVSLNTPIGQHDYYIITTDTTMSALPKEQGVLKEHKNKVSKWSSILSSASTAASSLGVLGAIAGKTSVTTGIKVLHTANTVDAAADAANSIGGMTGMDIVFKGAHSPYVIHHQKGTDLNFVAGIGDKTSHPMSYYRIVKLNTSKKERRIQVLEIKTSLLGSSKEQGYLPFEAHREGEMDCMITIQEKDIEPGEYAIIAYGASLVSAASFPVATFCIK